MYIFRVPYIQGTLGCSTQMCVSVNVCICRQALLHISLSYVAAKEQREENWI